MKEEVLKKTTIIDLDNNCKKFKSSNVSSSTARTRNSKKMKYLSVGGHRESYTFARKRYVKKILYVY